MIHILAVGRMKEAWMRDGCAEYCKRMQAWGGLSVVEVDEFRLPDNPSAAQIEQGLIKEGERLLERLPKNARLAALCIEGKPHSSEQLAQWIADGDSGSAVFVIGGSHGLSNEVKARAALRLSMSMMTFPHQLARVLLCEQVYRAHTILSGGKYHK